MPFRIGGGNHLPFLANCFILLTDAFHQVTLPVSCDLKTPKEDLNVYIDQASTEQLESWQAELADRHAEFVSGDIALDLTRGKPSADQLTLANALDGALNGNYIAPDGTDARNYGGLDGLPDMKKLAAELLEVQPEEILVGGNSSLTLMYQSVLFGWLFGFSAQPPWHRQSEVKFLCPVPGYDRHFSICEELGIKMVTVPMTDSGPDMDEVEQLVRQDSAIKGIWCVPKYSNPTGCVYSDRTVERLARLGEFAAADFRVFYDNAYAVHDLTDNPPALASIMDYCRRYQTEHSVLQFGSTSKVTFAGAGVSFLASSPANLADFRKHLAISTIGPDKVNQLRHLWVIDSMEALHAHMKQHAQLLAPRFAAVLAELDSSFGDSDLGSWTKPQGGYFVSFDTRPGLASEVVKLAAEAGVKLTPAGATFPYGNDPENRNIRIAPSCPSVDEIRQAMAVFSNCVKLASVRQKLAG